MNCVFNEFGSNLKSGLGLRFCPNRKDLYQTTTMAAATT